MRFFRILFLVCVAIGMSMPTVSFAEAGGISGTYNTAWLCRSSNCVTHTLVNWRPSKTLTTSPVIVSDSGLTGYIWSSEAGWINLSPTAGGATPTATSGCSQVGVGMTTSGSGTLTGCAFGSTTGWINFKPTNGGVFINDAGQLEGTAWVSNYGWMLFDCGRGTSSCVQTSWGRDEAGDVGDGGGGGGGGCRVNCGPAPVPGPGPDPYPGPVPGPGPGPGPGPLPTPLPGPLPAPVPTPTPYPYPTPRPEDIIGKLKKIIGSDTGKAIIRVVGIFGAVGGTAAALTTGLFLSPLSLGDFLLIPTRLWSLLLGSIGLLHRRRPWGTVYDSVTKQPLDPAVVTLRTLEGKEIASAITDLDGRYGFVVPEPGLYTMVANKSNYTFPSQKLVGRDHDELYRDLYFGETFKIEKAGEIVAYNIPMDREHFDWNEFAKNQKKLMRFYSNREKWLIRLSAIFFYIGFAVTALTAVLEPIRDNLIIGGLYVVLLVIRKIGLRPRPFGHVTSADTGEAIPYAIIRITQKTTGVEVMHRVADILGRYYALLPNGEYTVRIDEKLPDGSYRTAGEAIPVTVTKGYLSEKFAVKTDVPPPPPTPPVDAPPAPPVAPVVPTPDPEPAAGAASVQTPILNPSHELPLPEGLRPEDELPPPQ